MSLKSKETKGRVFTARVTSWQLNNLERYAKTRGTTKGELFREWLNGLCGGPWHAKAKTKGVKK